MTASTRHAISADYLFDGAVLHRDMAIIIEGPRIGAIVPKKGADGLPVYTLPPGAWLAPGFVDIQVNGGGDVLFNDAPTVSAISTIAAAHRKFGTTGFLVTLITDTSDKTALAMDAVQKAMAVEPSVLGLHLEGPFISPEKSGVHNKDLIRSPTPADIEALMAWPGHGALVVTLAPEQVPAGLIAKLATRGIRVSLGHSMATYQQTQFAIDEGLCGFTHLFNAMRGLESREPGPIAAALESPASCYGLIVDGVHVAPAMLRLAMRGLGNPMLVTDAMPPVGGQRSDFFLYDQRVRVTEGRCMRDDGSLAGACLDMASAVRNCVRLLDLPLEKALQLATANPGAFLGLHVGRLAPGYRADIIALDPREIVVLHTWVAGQSAER